MFGVSRQANYQYLNHQSIHYSQQELIVKQVLEIRANHPKLGTRKLFHMLQPFFHDNNFKIGRDALFNLLCEQKLLIRQRQRKATTTYSNHWLRKWPNLIKNYRLNAPNQLWVSDITYWKVMDKFLYISFITDAYSHKIVGYNLSQQLDMQSSRNALLMALKSLPKNQTNLIHHSDRGVQYCAMDYLKLLHQNNIKVSMTENGNPRENAIAERLNGIIKNEYLHKYKPTTFEKAEQLLKHSVELYNIQRPHLSINYQTPEFTHNNQSKTFRKWKNYFKINPVNVIQD